MTGLFLHEDLLARRLVIATVLVGVGAEAAATFLGRRRGAGRMPLGRAAVTDRGTKEVIALSLALGLVAAWLVAAKVPSLRLEANDWPGVLIGLGLTVAGIGLRVWAVWSLGGSFRRVVVIQEGQTLHRGGPYRLLRHPAYAGDVLAVFGLGLTLGSWVGALLAAVVALLGHLPRIAVEEQTLSAAFGDSWAEYARATARLVPGVW